MLFHCLNTYIFSPIDDELWLNTRSLYSYNSDIKWDLECFSWSPSTLSKKIESRESFTGGKQRLESDMIMNSCFTESRNYVVLKLKSACAWTLWPSCLLNLGSHSCSALSWWQPRIAELVFYNWHDFQGCQHQLKKSSLPIPFQPPSGCSLQGFLFQFLATGEAKKLPWMAAAFQQGDKRNQSGGRGRTQTASQLSSPFSLPRISWFVFPHFSSPTSPLASLLLLPSVSVSVWRCVGLHLLNDVS